MKDDSKKKAYAAAGVDIELAENLLDSVKPEIKKATRPEVLGAIGGFGGLFDISNLKQKEPVLVSSTDSVGTKVKVAVMAQSFEGLGYDIVNHCANDIAVTGAEPLFFLDYFATDSLKEEAYTQVLRGVAKACQEANIALVGGETAELPGVYNPNELDLVGSIVGVSEKKQILSGKPIQPGDKLIGIPSSGLHTNGFSLARKILFEDLGMSVTDKLPGTEQTISEALLAYHTNYSNLLQHLYAEFNTGETIAEREGNSVLGVAHITGGGLRGNLPRIFQEGIGAEIDTKSWEVPALFKFLTEKGNVDFEECYEAFNMGIGLVIVASAENADEVFDSVQTLGFEAIHIGEIVAGEKEVKLLK